VIKTCQLCGAINDVAAERCSFCDVPLNPAARQGFSIGAATPTRGNLAVQPEWRREVANRLHAYRARRIGRTGADLQSALPFETASASAVGGREQGPEFNAPPPATPPPRSASSRVQRVEIPVQQYELAPPAASILPPASGAGQETARTGLLPIASLAERGRSLLLDFALLAFSYGAMVALFWALGGHISLDRIDLAVMGATVALFYAQYFALFIVFGGSTPGMMLSGLRVVSFDGGVPSSKQMAWRSFGYLISAGTCLLGFLWALWDEEHLSWHDRISQTYLTPVEHLTGKEPPTGAADHAGTSGVDHPSETSPEENPRRGILF
jgi:uncharacterized RDD family membrane protein YckC